MIKIVDLTFLGVTVDMNYVMLGVLMYAVGLASVMAYRRLQGVVVAKRDYHADDAVVEAVISEYTRRLRDYDRAIAEMRAKIDIVELRSQSLSQPNVYVQQQPPQQPVATASQPARPHAPAVSEPVAVTQHMPEERRMEGQNGTTDYILKLLAEKPRTSREVQHAIGRTREHTARLMKKLTESGLVNRDMNSKPFRYGITEAGQARLREKPVAAPEIRRQA
ncbi:MAG: hypothetical protein ABI347_10140 [Nitrososphaera sp.]